MDTPVHIETIDGLMDKLIAAAKGGSLGDIQNARADLGAFMLHHLRRREVAQDAPKPPIDPVHYPAHYTIGKIECIDFLEDQQLGFHAGNVVKYVVRHQHKGNPLQDLEKARWYLDRLIQQYSTTPAQETES